MIANESKNSDDQEENDERGEFAGYCVTYNSNSNPKRKRGRNSTYLKAERGGGGGFGTEDPPQRPMVASGCE
jgi:hypothetical protein